MRNRRMLFLILALVAVCLAIWRLWPRTLEDVLRLSDLESASVIADSTEVMIENNSLKIESYRLDIPAREGERFVELLKSTSYRSDFRNLLPWDVSPVHGKDVSGVVAIGLNVGNERWVVLSLSEKTMTVTMYEGDVQQEEAMVLVYHPANRALLSEIKSYVRENGTKLE